MTWHRTREISFRSQQDGGCQEVILMEGKQKRKNWTENQCQLVSWSKDSKDLIQIWVKLPAALATTVQRRLGEMCSTETLFGAAFKQTHWQRTKMLWNVVQEAWRSFPEDYLKGILSIKHCSYVQLSQQNGNKGWLKTLAQYCIQKVENVPNHFFLQYWLWKHGPLVKWRPSNLSATIYSLESELL